MKASLSFADSDGGTLRQPTIGEVKDGSGEFFDQETASQQATNDRAIPDITLNSCHFERAFSNDGGKT